MIILSNFQAGVTGEPSSTYTVVPLSDSRWPTLVLGAVVGSGVVLGGPEPTWLAPSDLPDGPCLRAAAVGPAQPWSPPVASTAGARSGNHSPLLPPSFPSSACFLGAAVTKPLREVHLPSPRVPKSLLLPVEVGPTEEGLPPPSFHQKPALPGAGFWAGPRRDLGKATHQSPTGHSGKATHAHQGPQKPLGELLILILVSNEC